jgi:hypothetical protein
MCDVANVYSSPGPNSSMDFDNHVIQVIIIFFSVAFNSVIFT